MPASETSWLERLKLTIASVTVGEVSGTAFLIGPRHVLTALHVLDCQTSVNLCFPSWPGRSDDRQRVGHRVWRHPAGADLAIVELDRPCPANVEVLPWAGLPAPRANWYSYGFPPDIDGLPLIGTSQYVSDPSSGGADDPFSFLSLWTPDGRYSVRGFSGAPCVVDNHIVGVLTHQLSRSKPDPQGKPDTPEMLSREFRDDEMVFHSVYALPIGLVRDARSEYGGAAIPLEPGPGRGADSLPPGLADGPVSVLWQVDGAEQMADVLWRPGLNRTPWLAVTSGFEQDGLLSGLELTEMVLKDATARVGFRLPERTWRTFDIGSGELSHEQVISTTMRLVSDARITGLRIRVDAPITERARHWIVSLVRRLAALDAACRPATLVHVMGVRAVVRDAVASEIHRALTDLGLTSQLGRRVGWAEPRVAPCYRTVAPGAAVHHWQSEVGNLDATLPTPASVVLDLAHQSDIGRTFEQLANTTYSLRPEALPDLLEEAGAAASVEVRTAGLRACYRHDALIDCWLRRASIQTNLIDIRCLATEQGLTRFLILGLLRHRNNHADEVDAYLERLDRSVDKSLARLVRARQQAGVLDAVVWKIREVHELTRAGVRLPLAQLPDDLLVQPAAWWALATRAWSIDDMTILLGRSQAVRAALGLLQTPEWQKQSWSDKC